jgi:hypothetical protein
MKDEGKLGFSRDPCDPPQSPALFLTCFPQFSQLFLHAFALSKRVSGAHFRLDMTDLFLNRGALGFVGRFVCECRREEADGE